MKIPDQINLTAIEYPSPSELCVELEKALPEGSTPTNLSSDPKSSELAILRKAIVAIANQSWRIYGSVNDADSKEPRSDLTPQDIKKIVKALESISETLTSLGIKIIDRMGESYDSGLPDQVITEEPQEGISKQQIIRTIRPTIIWNQVMVQRGEIDTAVPISIK